LNVTLDALSRERRKNGRMATRPKRPRDPFQLAKLIGDISTGQAEDEDPDAGKDPAAVSLGRKGGLKGALRGLRNFPLNGVARSQNRPL
jgi:hypothetical protein